jgi:uncharacterized protein (DUF2252 family)
VNSSQICLPEDRTSRLDLERNLKMSRSAHAYVRGSTQKFYEWLGDSAAGKLLPLGPPVWICGDCHLGNLGPVADAKGRVKIAIRDLDQAVIGNPAHDLIRLALSLATAIRGSDLPGITTALMMEQMMDGYEGQLAPSRKSKRSEAAPKAVQRILEHATKRRWHHLAEERIENVKPEIPQGRRFWPLTPQEAKEIDRIFDTPEVRHLVTSLQSRDDDDKVKVLDAAYWVKGCSSLGRLRFAVLLGVGKKKHRQRQLCLFDIKESPQSAAPRYSQTGIPKDNAKRVVEGAKKLSPYLGNRMLPWHFGKKSVVLRELLPQDLKLVMDELTRDEAIGAARYLASVVARAHAGQMERAAQREWLADLRKNRSRSLDTPLWLWKSVVELVASHETAYLEHCRQHAMAILK